MNIFVETCLHVQSLRIVLQQVAGNNWSIKQKYAFDSKKYVFDCCNIVSGVANLPSWYDYTRI